MNLDSIYNSKWFVIKNDLVGGWCVSTMVKPLDEYTREDFKAFPIVAECIFKELAEYIAEEHNESIGAN